MADRLGRLIGALCAGVEPRPQQPPWGWQFQRSTIDGYNHLLPTWDTKTHALEDRCPCRPELDEGGFTSHNAFDGRERYEKGGAPRH